jgi:hypothetical protein
MKNDLHEKLKQAAENINEVEFVIKYKGKKIHEALIPIPKYADEIIKDKEVSFHYLFRDFTKILRAKIDEEHKDAFWKRQDGDGVLKA